MSTATTAIGLVEPVMREFEGIFREHADLVFGTARSIMQREEDAEDVVQTVFIRLLRSGMPTEFQRNPKGYLYRAAINQSLNIIRERRRHPTTDLSIVTAAEPPADTDSKEELHRKLHDAIAELCQCPACWGPKVGMPEMYLRTDSIDGGAVGPTVIVLILH